MAEPVNVGKPRPLWQKCPPNVLVIPGRVRAGAASTLVVITSYSIHYTKLYDDQHAERERGNLARLVAAALREAERDRGARDEPAEQALALIMEQRSFGSAGDRVLIVV